MVHINSTVLVDGDSQTQHQFGVYRLHDFFPKIFYFIRQPMVACFAFSGFMIAHFSSLSLEH